MLRPGTVLIYVTLGMGAFAAIVALAIDVAHVRLVKTELQGAADAAARAGGQQMQGGAAVASAAAVAAAADNTSDGSAVVVVPGTDIDFGLWSGGTFTPLSGAALSNANAIRVRCVRAASRGNGVSAAFASFLGIGSADVTAQAIVTGVPTPVAGFIGYASVTSNNNTFFGGYNSAANKNPTRATTDTNMRVGTNGSVSLKNNDEIKGNVVLGPQGNKGGGKIDGTTYYWASTLPTPTLPPWNPGANPNGVPQDYTISSNTTLPGGSYWFTSMTLSANLTFSGPAILYINGPIMVGGTLAPASGVPSDLKIYQYGNTTFGDAASNGMTIVAAVVAPGADFSTRNNLDYYGSGIFNSITTQNNAEFFYDEAEGPMNGSNAVAIVQ